MRNRFIFTPIDAAYPFLCGAVASAWLCLFLVFPQFEAKTGVSLSGLAAKRLLLVEAPGDEFTPKIDTGNVLLEDFSVPEFVHRAAEKGDSILNAYRNEAQHQWVKAFFTGVLKSSTYSFVTSKEEISAAILSSASAFDIPPSLAFALCWAESEFNPRAVNRSNRDGSIDRGLFQLNNRSFPNLKDAEFFNPSISAHYGMAHLRMCLDAGGSVVAGLAMYNAGTHRVTMEGAPKQTLNYISRILEFQQQIEYTFSALPLPAPLNEELAMKTESVSDSDLIEPYLGKLRLTLLTPIAGWF
ncbi:MAG: transglycosylase SLT domain-containing protein [Treponema sp.]|jgi:hypothetical protein|nr:transglycosylase SLT domain-containing protein [Treponema sp.]